MSLSPCPAASLNWTEGAGWRLGDRLGQFASGVLAEYGTPRLARTTNSATESARRSTRRQGGQAYPTPHLTAALLHDMSGLMRGGEEVREHHETDALTLRHMRSLRRLRLATAARPRSQPDTAYSPQTAGWRVLGVRQRGPEPASPAAQHP